MGLYGSVGAKKDDGRRSENYPQDVRIVRKLLNIHIKYNPQFRKDGFAQLPLNGTHEMSETIRAIMEYQMYMLNNQQPSGRIDPLDNVLKALINGDVPGKPAPPAELLAPIEDQIHNQLTRAYYSDDWGPLVLDQETVGEIKSMIKLLLYDP